MEDGILAIRIARESMHQPNVLSVRMPSQRGLDEGQECRIRLEPQGLRPGGVPITKQALAVVGSHIERKIGLHVGDRVDLEPTGRRDPSASRTPSDQIPSTTVLRIELERHWTARKVDGTGVAGPVSSQEDEIGDGRAESHARLILANGLALAHG